MNKILQELFHVRIYQPCLGDKFLHKSSHNKVTVYDTTGLRGFLRLEDLFFFFFFFQLVLTINNWKGLPLFLAGYKLDVTAWIC